MLQKFKDVIAEDVYFFSLLIIVVSILSFGLGRLSMQDIATSQQAAVQLTQKAQILPEPTLSDSGELNQQLVGSKNGTKYHALWCPGATQIKDANKIYFASVQEAHAKGYSPAANCKGI